MLKSIKTAIVNIKLWARGSPVRFGYSQSENLYFVVEKAQKVYFGEWRRGLRLYKRGLSNRAELIYSEYLLSKIQIKDRDLIIDCGANYGDLLLAFKMKGLNVDYIGIEPGEAEFTALSRNAVGQKVVKGALGEYPGKQVFYMSSEGADSSLIEPANYTEKVITSIFCLDDLIKGSVKLLKLEAEGCEIEVLKGSKAVLKNIEFIAADLGPERGVNKELTFMPVYEFLTSRGFQLIELGYPRLVALFRNSQEPFD